MYSLSRCVKHSKCSPLVILQKHTQTHTHTRTHFALERGIMCTLVVTHYLVNKLIHGIFVFYHFCQKFIGIPVWYSLCVCPFQMLLTNLVNAMERKKYRHMSLVEYRVHTRFTNFWISYHHQPSNYYAKVRNFMALTEWATTIFFCQCQKRFRFHRADGEWW